VGSQALTRIPVLSRLRHDDELATVSRVWPFEVTVPDSHEGRPVVIHAEIWPSLVHVPRVDGQVKDQTQVTRLAEEFRDRDRAGTLWDLFPAAGSSLALVEGWILGVAGMSGSSGPEGRERPRQQPVTPSR